MILTIYHAKKQFYMHGIKIPKNAVIAFCDNDDVYLCVNFPRDYKGNNPILWVSSYDRIMQCWYNKAPMNNYITRCMWDYYVGGGHKLMRQEPDYADMMRHERRPKRQKISKSSGQGILLERENYYASTTYTDYECTKYALNDFARL